MPFNQDNLDNATYFSKITDYSSWANFPGGQAFGNNSFGQLGLNTLNAGYSSPVAITNQLAYPAWIDVAYLRNGIGLGFVNQNNQPFFAGQAVSDTTVRSSPVQIGARSLWTQVSCGDSHAIGLQLDGTIWTWGNNSFGQLGSSNTTNRSSPTQLGTLSTWTAVSAGSDNSAAINSPGFLWTWGNNSYGQLGLSDVTHRSSPVQISQQPIAALWRSIGLQPFSRSQLAIQTNGTLWAWGNNSFGQLGLSDQTNRSSPVQIGSLSVWTQISGGANFSYAIQSNGTLWSWGNNSFGQLGLSDQTHRSSPAQIGALSTWVQVAAGNRHVMLIQSNGTLWACGYNSSGQLGLNDTVTRFSPVQVGALSIWARVSSGSNHSMAITSQGTLWSWGDNGSGQLGLNTNTIPSISSPAQVGSLSVWSQVASGDKFNLLLQNTGTLWSCGYNLQGQLGLNTTLGGVSSLVQIGSFSIWSQVACGQFHSLAITSLGTLWAWGNNNNGQLGINTVTQSSPLQVGTLSIWTRISCGYATTAVLANTGQLNAFGNNSFGQLGLNTLTNFSSPIQVGSTPWSQISCAKGYQTAAIQSNGTLWMWGNNNFGQLGLSDTTNRSSPVQVGTISFWSQVSSGSSHTAAIQRVDQTNPQSIPGSLWAWGQNSSGELGLNTTTGISSPVQIGALTTWAQVSCGSAYTLARQVNGTLWAWGSNAWGKLGLNTTTDYSSPVQVGSLTNWTNIATSGLTSFGIISPGILYAWGNNTLGVFGNNSTALNNISPLQIGTTSTWTNVAVGTWFTAATQINGTLWSWGANSFGQLGIYNPGAYSLTNYPSQFSTGNYNKVTASSSQLYFRKTADNVVVQTSAVDIPPIDISQTIGWNSYDTGQFHFIGVQSNGTAWSIGNNSFGQLGLNTTTSSISSITQIGSGTNWARAIAADFGSMLIDNSNNAWVFGNNSAGQLGLSDNTNRSSPVQITYATGIKNAAMDNFDIWLVDGSNNLWAGGIGNKLAANTTTSFTYPTQKFTSNFWNNVATNQDSTLLVGANSAIYALGNNTFGQLGISANTNTYQFSPVQIGSINTTVKVETKVGSSIILFK